MLRDALCSLPDFGTWPCDEVNYIWRHGNVGVPHDEMTPDHARPQVRRYVRRQFAKRAREGGVVVEKTCANSLRVGFVERVLPEAKFVWIVRDGRDAVASTRRRWHAKLEPGYAAAKGRFIPPIDLPYYAVRHVARRAHRLWSAEGRVASWGPRVADMDELLASRPLLEVCARQWQRCVQKAERDLSALDPAQVHRVYYEDFVADPAGEFADIATFAGGRVAEADVNAAVRHVSRERATTPRTLLGDEERVWLESLLAPTLAAHGYE